MPTSFPGGPVCRALPDDAIPAGIVGKRIMGRESESATRPDRCPRTFAGFPKYTSCPRVPRYANATRSHTEAQAGAACAGPLILRIRNAPALRAGAQRSRQWHRRVYA